MTDQAAPASSTSFYTNAEKELSYDSLDATLDKKCNDSQLKQVIKDMMEACAEIASALKTSLVTVEGSSNNFGDTVLSVDVSELWFNCATFLRTYLYGLLTNFSVS